jgi:hypothetical protein
VCAAVFPYLSAESVICLKCRFAGTQDEQARRVAAEQGRDSAEAALADERAQLQVRPARLFVRA